MQEGVFGPPLTALCAAVLVQEGSSRLPDLHITDKNDTFHMNGDTYAAFRLMARPVKRDLYGNPVALDNISPAVSAKFIVRRRVWRGLTIWGGRAGWSRGGGS